MLYHGPGLLQAVFLRTFRMETFPVSEPCHMSQHMRSSSWHVGMPVLGKIVTYLYF